LTFLVWASCCIPFLAYAEPYQPDGDGQVVMEAEHFDLNVGLSGRDWVADSTAGYVGDSAMQSVPNSWFKITSNLAATSPRMDYEVEYTAPVTLNVWVRGLGLSGSRDSIWIGIDGNDGAAQNISLTRDSYGWAAAGQLAVSAGVHTINVWMREDGSIVDRILLTPLSTTPTGDGPAESTRGTSTPGNTPPEAFDDSFTVNEDSVDNPLAVLADNGGGGPDADPDGDPITIVSVQSPGSANGTVAANGTSDGLNYTPEPDFAGTETFDYTIGDGLGGFATATVTVTVNNSNNDVPVLAPVGPRTATEEQSLSFTVSASDVDGAPLPNMSADLTELPGTPSFTDNSNGTGSFSWTPSAGDAPGPYSVTFTATDAVDGSLSSSEVISIDVQPAGSGGGSGAYQPDGNGQFVMEAEHYDLNVSQGGRDWVDDFTAGYVGDGAMQSIPNTWHKVVADLNANSPRLDYEVELAAPATLNVWIRGLGLSGSRDSVWIGVDGNDGAARDVSVSRGSYGWTTSGQVSLSAGVHTINLWMREDGAIVDRLLLTPLATVPSGDGPAESTRGGGGGPPANVAPVLAPIGDRSATEEQTLSFTVSASDADVPIMIADLSQLPGTPSFTDNDDGTGSFSWTPSAGDAPGPYTVTFTATDAVDSALTAFETISIDVQAAPTGGGGGSGAYQPDGSGRFVMEAEHFDLNVSRGGRDWSEDFTSGFVGDSAMQSVPNTFLKVNSGLNTNSPRMDYEVELAAPATLNLWVRGLGLSGSRDSIWIGVDGNDVAARSVSLTRGGYGWTTAGQVSVPAGVHTINVWMREDGAIVDRLLLTPLSNVPSGDGPAESTRGGGAALPLADDFSDGDAAGWTIVDDATQFPSNWNVAGQVFVQAARTNSSGKDVTETYHRGSYAYWTQSAAHDDYRLSVDVTPSATSGDDIGVMFRYADSSHYYRFSLNVLNGLARLESNLNGTYMTLASDHRGYVPGQLYQIVVEAEGPLLQVFVNGDPLFAVSNTHHASGGIALFSRDASTFDNVVLDANNTAPEIVISVPTAHNVLPGAPLDLNVAAVARNVPAGTGSVLFQYGNGGSATLCDAAVEGPSGVFAAQCLGVPAGEYSIDAILLDGGAEIDRDTNAAVAIGGGATGSYRYDAIGNSITRGVGDNYSFDTLNLDDQRTVSISGWPALLGDLLTTSTGVPNLVGNEGISGDKAFETRDQRLFSIIERNPDSDRALVTLGTNDSNDFNTTSTTDLTAALQSIIDTLHANGRDTVYLSLLPPAWGRNNSSGPFADPLASSATRNQTVMTYNQAIQAMLPQAGVLLGPDFFSCFLTPTVNRFSLFVDNLHPNALGYAFMAALWNDAITSGPIVPPVDPCPSPIYILESLDPYAHGHKQNLLEEGDEYYTDAALTLTNVPPELADGVWVMQANADNANTDADFLSFDAGAGPVTVYIAYDPAGAPPTSSSHSFSPVSLSENLTVSDGAVGTFSVVRATAVAGNVTIGGNKSGLAPAAQQGYIVIVVE